MKTADINIINRASNNMVELSDGSVDLIITSPPYPMIEMWDDVFADQSNAVKSAFSNKEWNKVFEEMHTVLDFVWKECDRVLKDNGFVCINIGDATRTCDGEFQLFSNHTRIIESFMRMGYSVLPDIHWRKQSNAPNKFMGSGMFPAGAYVTYEHEYILIFRKGGKRTFKNNEEKQNRRSSAYFWEERNVWFSDLWDIKGTAQKMKKTESRSRSASYPLEIPYRLVNMYSVYGDTVLDPFGGLSTTAVACAALGRHCYCYDIDACMCECSAEIIEESKPMIDFRLQERIESHLSFIDDLSDEKKEKLYMNLVHRIPVKTRQEQFLTLYRVNTIEKIAPLNYRVSYGLAEIDH